MKRLLLLSLFTLTLPISAQNQYAELEKIMTIKNVDVRSQTAAMYFNDIGEEDYNHMSDHAQQLYKMAQKAGDKHLQAVALCGLSYANTISDNGGMSLDYALRALKMAEPLRNASVMTFVKGALSLNYADPKKSLALTHESLKFAKKSKFDRAIIILTTNLGMIHLYQNQQPDSAQIYLQKAERLLRQGKKPGPGLMVIYFSLADLYTKWGQRQMANVCYKMLKEEMKKANSPRFLSVSYDRLAQMKFRLNDKDSAAYYAKKAIATVENTKMLNLRLRPAKMLTDIYRGKDDKQAMYYADIFMDENAKRTDFNILQQTQLMMFNEELRQKSITEEHAKAAEERQHTIQYAIIFTGIITFFIFFLLLSRTVIVNEKWISFLAILALLLVFEFINLLIHPFLGNLTHHSPIWMLLCMVGLASLLIPLHHKIEHYIKHRLTEKNKAIRLAAAKRTIEQLEIKEQ